MFEAVIAAAIIVALIAAAMIPPLTLLWIGVGVGSLGVLLGMPAGFVYHGLLWRALRAEELGTEGMWLRPYRLHAKLSDPQREKVQAWFAAGALGFGLTMLGATAVVTGLVRLAGQ
ncbi:hypothetical protein ENSA5_48670 [Enhygromyxa salina]|uniref:Uncharacterized protein n=1 Tax=Enhygromyxa salina TaxID=215803 RepID=A0A2S9XHU9_9BACT|nr:hypothetical protein [Enhygromyxa salina]PRP92449.1 hypothetical protein ENSA5_48670 [Enhygromyxa salina]